METISLDTVESTNLYVKTHIDELSDMTVVHAQKQSNGRGRLQRKWVDLGEGNLFLTFVLKPSNMFSNIYSNLTQYLAVVLCRVLENYGLKPEIKWPNDVLVNGKKIAGILSETVMQGSLFKGLALGIGVNLRADNESVKLVKDKDITALNMEINKDVDTGAFREDLCSYFFSEYNNFLNRGFELIQDDYILRACFLGKEITVKLFNSELKGVAKSITGNGELVLIDKNNKEFVLTIGDIL